MTNPCFACGACCASFRVSFYWGETDAQMVGGVPSEFTRQITPHRVAMLGTEGIAPRCVALQGVVSQSVHCSIYSRRPSTCRAFEGSFSDGVTPCERCDKARILCGLSPLTPEDWI